MAAGRGERLGAGMPKALVECGGRPLAAWSLDVLTAAPEIAHVGVALPGDPRAGELLTDGVHGVDGGAERSHSVRAALAAAPSGPELVLVHDAARPLVTPAIIAATVAACAQEGVDAAIAAAPVTDTIKSVRPGSRIVETTLDRSLLWAVQTPQVFRREALERVLAQDDAVLAAATDDASLIERAGGTVVLVENSEPNLKVTGPTDLRLAALLLTATAG